MEKEKKHCNNCENKITEQDLKDLKYVINYFKEHDKTIFEHKAYAVLNSLYQKLNINEVKYCTFCGKSSCNGTCS
jgi:hypothetical protein